MVDFSVIVVHEDRKLRWRDLRHHDDGLLRRTRQGKRVALLLVLWWFDDEVGLLSMWKVSNVFSRWKHVDTRSDDLQFHAEQEFAIRSFDVCTGLNCFVKQCQSLVHDVRFQNLLITVSTLSVTT